MRRQWERPQLHPSAVRWVCETNCLTDMIRSYSSGLGNSVLNRGIPSTPSWRVAFNILLLGIAISLGGFPLVLAQELSPDELGALQRKAEAAPEDPLLLFELAKSYSAAKQPKTALQSIERAVALEPTSVDYLRLRGELATWVEEWAIAQDSYQRILALVPEADQAVYWFRLAQSYSGAKQPKRGLEAVGRSVELDPANLEYWRLRAELATWAEEYEIAQSSYKQVLSLVPEEEKTVYWYRLAQAFSGAKQPSSALEAVEQAVRRDPGNVNYWRFRSELAIWVGEYEIARDSFAHILALAPGDGASQLGLARVKSWTGQYDEAVYDYDAYLKEYPRDQAAWIEFARVESWRENYGAALKILEKYDREFGETEDYLRTKARVLAWAGRPREALTIVEPRLNREPDDYELNLTRSVALANSRQPRQAVGSLGVLQQLDPYRDETMFAERFVTTSLRPSLTPGFRFYNDSNGLNIYHVSLEGGHSMRPETRFLADIETDWLQARSGSGLDRLDGGGARHARAWVGFDHLFSPGVAVNGQLGAAFAEGDQNMLTYRFGVDLQPRDQLNLQFERNAGFYAVSPRSVGLGIKRATNRFAVAWQPGMHYYLDAEGGYHTISDSNRGWELAIAPRRNVMRSENFNLDLGVRAQWFGFRDDFDHGYYDPDLYQSYAFTGSGYWKLSRDDGLNFIVVLGRQKDSATPNFRFSGNVFLGGTFGLYRDLMLRLGGNLTYGGLASGAYRGHSLDAALTWRF